MKFSADFIEKVRDANNVVDVISQYTQLKPMAGGYMGRCPFPDHQEKTASFSASEAKQVYHCFGCHKKGNIFTFVQEFMGLNFPDAVEYLASRARIPLPEKEENNEQHDQLARKKKEIININRLAVQFFHENFRRLPENHPVKKYALEKRGLSVEIINEFQIGYATEEWDGLVHFLQSKGVSIPLAEEARLVKARKEGNGFFDIFRDRLMFPIFNPINEPVAFGGRIISTGEPKYLNSGETPVFNKSKILFGHSHTAKYIRSEDQAIVVEGYMDLVSLYQSGIKNVVAPMGTALTFEQSKLLLRMTKNVVVLFDGDKPGQEAAEKSLPILLSADLHPKGLILPDEQDPDDFVKAHGAESLKTLVAQSADLFMMILSRWLRGYRGEPSEKVKISDWLRPIFSSIQDIRLKKLYLQEAAQKLGVDEAWMRSAVQGSPTQQTQIAKPLSSAPKNIQKEALLPKEVAIFEGREMISLKGLTKPEALLLGLSLKNANNFSMLEESGILNFIIHKGFKSLLAKAAETYRQNPEKFDKLAGLISSFVDDPDVVLAPDIKLSKELLGEEGGFGFDSEKEQRLLKDCFKRIKDHYLKTQTDKLTLELKQESSPEKLELLMKLQRDRMALNKEP